MANCGLDGDGYALTMTETAQIQTFLDLHAKSDGMPVDHCQALLDRGVASDTAALLVWFVPMAFAYERLTALGVDVPLHFTAEAAGGVRVRARLFDQPLFVAARKAAMRLADGDAGQRHLLEQISALSSECGAASRLVSPDGNFHAMELTEAVLLGAPLQRIQLPSQPLALADSGSGVQSEAQRWERRLHWIAVGSMLCIFLAMTQSHRPWSRLVIAHLQAVCVLAWMSKHAISALSPEAPDHARPISGWILLAFVLGLLLSLGLVVRAWLDPAAPVIPIRLHG